MGSNAVHYLKEALKYKGFRHIDTHQWVYDQFENQYICVQIIDDDWIMVETYKHISPTKDLPASEENDYYYVNAHQCLKALTYFMPL